MSKCLKAGTLEREVKVEFLVAKLTDMGYILDALLTRELFHASFNAPI